MSGPASRSGSRTCRSRARWRRSPRLSVSNKRAERGGQPVPREQMLNRVVGRSAQPDKANRRQASQVQRVLYILRGSAAIAEHARDGWIGILQPRPQIEQPSRVELSIDLVGQKPGTRQRRAGAQIGILRKAEIAVAG